MFIPLILVLSAIAFTGCTGNNPMLPLLGDKTGNSIGPPAPGPTVTLPPGQNIEIQVNEKDPIYATITVIFAGGKGQIAVKDILARVTSSDGKVTEQHLAPKKGSEVVFQGTKGDDRLEVIVTLNTGISYKIIDRIIPYRTRG